MDPKGQVGEQGLGTKKGIENYRDRTEIRRKKRDVKAMNCGERVGGQGIRGGGHRSPLPMVGHQ